MFKLLKRLFQKEDSTQLLEEVNFNDLNSWLENKVSNLSIKNYLEQYFARVNQIKEELYQKIEILQRQQISEKDIKQVEGKIRNVVIGHKDHYVREVGRFTNSITTLTKISTMQSYQESLDQVTNLNKEIETLASRTQKSYQASQHLFFDQVEPCFKLLGELNKLVQETTQHLAQSKIGQLPEITTLINQFHEEVNKKNDLEKTKTEKLQSLEKYKKEVTELGLKLNNLNNSQEYVYLKELKRQELKLVKRRKEIENNIFSFFSKLQKPLKKYERIAINNKNIKNYIDDGIKTFKMDKDLSVKEILQGLKRNINGLQFDERQKKNALELILKSEEGFLDKLFSQEKELQGDELQLHEKINKLSVKNLIEQTENKIKKVQQLNVQVESECKDIEQNLANISEEKIRITLQDLIQQIIKIEIKLI